MTRRTRADLEQKLKVIHTRLGIQNEYSFDYLGQRPRLIDSRNSDISPRLTVNGMYDWLDAFVAGIDACWLVATPIEHSTEGHDEETAVAAWNHGAPSDFDEDFAE